MASKKKQKGMVFHQEGPTRPAGDPPPACFSAPKPGKASKGMMEQSTGVIDKDAGVMGKPNMYPSKEAIRTSAGLPAVKPHTSSNPQSDNLSPDSICKGIRVTLDNNSMWNEFFRCKTEMILTKQGSRMFPYCRFHISGLEPLKKYSLIMDIQPLDNNQYRWTGKSWQVAGKAECHVKSQPFAHPDSPSTGQHWIQNPVSFYKLKLTNNISDQEGNTILHPMHRYLPRLHMVQTDEAPKDIKLNSPRVITFTFPQTEFMAVTAYQNSRFAQLKVDYNPFAKGLKEDRSSSWGLKLKLNSSKDSHKDGGTTTNELHPVKKSLKSLLANHKPRTAKAVETKPSVSRDLRKISNDQSAAKDAGESSRSSRPPQKLFSELIREAHVSLQRCNLEQLGKDNSTSERTEKTNTGTTALKSNKQDEEVSKKDSMSIKKHGKISPANKGESVVSKRKVKEDRDSLNSLNCKDSVAAASAVVQTSSVDSHRRHKPDTHTDLTVKHHKRPVPLPLPALALFLKQHSAKSKKTKSKPDSPSSALPPESLSGSQSSAEASAHQPSDHAYKASVSSKNLTGDITESDNTSGQSSAELHPDEMVLNVTGRAVETSHQPPSPTCSGTVATADPKGPRMDDFSVSVTGSPQPTVPDYTPVLPNSDQPPCILGTSIPTISSTLSTSSSSPILSLAPNLPQTPTITESSTLPSDCATTKSDSLLADPECPSFGFEPLSPGSSPEPLPSLPVTVTLQLDSTTSEPTLNAAPHTEDSAASVFTWHTVLPPPEPYIDTSFTTFQPTPHTLPLVSVTSPLLSSQTPPDPDPQTLSTSSCTATPDPAPSFHENEQSLPFPAELSPLALQLPLSPTFSSLDGEGLSPTPSIADLVHFFSTDGDLGMGVDFSNTEAVSVPCPPSTVETNAHDTSQQVQPANKPCKRKKKSSRRKLAKADMDSTYTSMQPNLEEVEEQLFISFTSKEALKLHTVDSSEGSQPQAPAEGPLQQTTEEPENGLKDLIGFEKNLVRDLKLMRHRQVIHPVLQEVGLKMNLLDPTLAIDLQYLGVRLPIPPPGVSLEPPTQELPPTPGASAAFVSRTGKTNDLTQIKGWREKFSPSETPSTPAAKPEAGPSSDQQKKNLSAFCSDMLDEYLENEGKLIDQRAASFSPPVVAPVVYELPARSTSYVRTLDSVLKKTVSSPTSDLISGFVPPSRRPRAKLKETRMSRRESAKQKRMKPNKPAAPLLSPADSNPPTKQSADQISASPPPSEHTAPLTGPHKKRKYHLKVRSSSLSPQSPTIKRRRKLKPKTSSRTLSPSRSTGPRPRVSEDMAPLESDSELGVALNASDGRPVMTRTLLKQKDLEDGVVWAGRPPTSVTEERAAVALSALFTLMGFVSENPTAPVQLVRRRAPPCLNEFCRLGCVCSSLSHCCRISHCGRPACMLGCSCLKQKVVLLKNLDGSDSSPSHHGSTKRRKRKRRMKMAYILKEADSVSQPAERVRTLWQRDSRDSDPDPIHVPEPAALSRPPTERREDAGSCARVRGYRGKKSRKRRPKETSKEVKSKGARLKPLKHRDLTLQDPKTKPSRPAAAADLPPSPSAEPVSKPSKRLIILAECKWTSDSERSHVLKKLCERMAQDQLDEPFWIKNYLISPMSQTVEESDADRCTQYKIHISRPNVDRQRPAAPEKPQRHPREARDQQVVGEAEPADWQGEVKVEEAGPIEDWQQEVEEGDLEEEAGLTVHQVHDGRESSREKMKVRPLKKKERVCMALPFLTGISPAGFLSAKRKQPGGTEHLVEVNGKLYPLAKIQLGKMGALHPANRLAAYLTGRVGSNRKQQGSSSAPPQSSAPAPPNCSSVVPGLAPTPPPRAADAQTVIQPAAVKLDQSAASSDRPAGEAPEGAGSRLVAVTVVYPRPTGSHHQVRAAPSSAPTTDSQVSVSPVDPKGSQLFMIQVPGPRGKLPVAGLRLPPGPPPPLAGSQRMFLKPVQAASGVQYFRKPDGKLVQLVPVSQLRAAPPSAQRVLPATSRQTQVISVVNPTPPRTIVAAPPPSSSLSGFQPLPVPPFPPTSGFLPQKEMCSFKILPSSSGPEPVIVTCPKAPPQPPTVTAKGAFNMLQPPPSTTPVNFMSIRPPTGRRAELGVQSVTVSSASVGPSGVLIPQSDTPPIYTPAGTPHLPPPLPPAPPQAELTAAPPPYPEPELASDLQDLDIICVDDVEAFVSMETVGGVRRPGVASSDTENSSDFSDESEDEEEKRDDYHRHVRNVLEKQRRGELLQLLEGLRREVGLSEEKTSKIFTLMKAVQVIEELRMTEMHLMKKKKALMKRRDEYLSIIVPTEESRGQRSRRANTGSADVMEVVNLSTDGLKDSSSDEERTVTKTTGTISDMTVCRAADGSVSMETEESSQLDAAQTKQPRISRNADADARSITAALRSLSSVMNAENTPKGRLLKQAHQEIRTLESETKRLKSLKVCLNQQRNAYIREISRRSGESEQRILRKLQHLSSKQREEQERHQTANQLPVATGGGASELKMADDDVIITSSNTQRQTPQAPPTATSAPPTSTPVQQTDSRRVLQAVLTPPGVSHNASVLRNKQRTVPNILSRSKNPTQTSTLHTPSVEASPSVKVPSEVLSLVGTALPGQPVLALSPLMVRQTVLQTTSTTGVASVTLNLPAPTNQQIHLSSLPRPPTGKIYSSSAPLTVTNLTAANFNSLLHLPPPQTTQQQTQPPPLQQQQVSAPLPVPPVLVVSGGSGLCSDQIRDQDQHPSWADPAPESRPPSRRPASGSCAGLSAEVTLAGRSREDPDNESLTSLLNEIVFLNQQPVTTATTTGVLLPRRQTSEAGLWGEGTTVGGAKKQEQEETMKTEEAGLNNHSATTESESELRPANGTAAGGVLAPPPLLHMKLGGAKVADPAFSDGAAGGGGGGRGRGGVGEEGGVTWRPMPRLVPLGLKGTPPS